MSRDYRAELRAVRDPERSGPRAHRLGLMYAAALWRIRGLTAHDVRPCEDRMADVVRILDAVDEIEKEER